jgi:hypothetical protein
MRCGIFCIAKIAKLVRNSISKGLVLSIYLQRSYHKRMVQHGFCVSLWTFLGVRKAFFKVKKLALLVLDLLESTLAGTNTGLETICEDESNSV